MFLTLNCKEKRNIDSPPSQYFQRTSCKLPEIFKTFNLTEVEPTEGFNLEGIFSRNLTMLQYGNLFTKITKGSGEEVGTSKEKETTIPNDDVVTKVSINLKEKRPSKEGKTILMHNSL